MILNLVHTFVRKSSLTLKGREFKQQVDFWNFYNLLEIGLVKMGGVALCSSLGLVL